MSSATLLHTNGSKPHISMDAWLQTSTRKFFSSVNWDDNPPEIQEIKQKVAENPTAEDLSRDLTVGQFFAAVNWDDDAAVAPPAADNFLAELLEEPANNFTLDDFSDLF
ncbi:MULTISPECIES: hypothetical protein [unclassified Leptolyngbya]|uniref:hypothetical protein n=1 Tax=unclassified Leptolyngbya TaxID=2650499 RepID=UPI0016880E9B|nr:MULTISPECIES: hypothetical protein [unclassified Leptolyngbya]MBD1910072.1 hypothetical protein [Leptolyngbya sp. FACHB-8]MBD2158745.1 hypothetical protein [Leptolyngbya sp. FACHB-16]